MAELPVGVAAQVGSLFDAKAASWAQKYAPGGALTERLSQFSRAVRDQAPAGSAVLDLGCGTGDLALHLAGAGLRLTGCDISASMLAVAAGRDTGQAVHWTGLDPGWQELPFAGESFDAVTAASVLEYVQDPVAVLRECGRVLRPGGTMHLTVPDLRHRVRWLEGPARLVAVILPAGAWAALPGRAGARMGPYATYLRLSRQRHRLSWWRATAREAGLRLINDLPPQEQAQPLRLLLLVRAPSGRAD